MTRGHGAPRPLSSRATLGTSHTLGVSECCACGRNPSIIANKIRSRNEMGYEYGSARLPLYRTVFASPFCWVKCNIHPGSGKSSDPITPEPRLYFIVNGEVVVSRSKALTRSMGLGDVFGTPQCARDQHAIRGLTE